MIEIRGLCKKFQDTPVLQGIDIDIADGDIYGLVGVSGAGKSTLLRCINGLLPYDDGTLKVNGVEINLLKEKELREFRSQVGMIFQQFSLLERMNVLDNVCLPMKCLHYDKAEMKRKAMENLELVGLADRIKARPQELSGGQKQRVAIARALTLEPKIMLCDEATSALDPNITEAILELLQEINQKKNITMVVVTHQMEVVKKICNKMSILSHGKLTISGGVQDIFMNNPDSLYELLGKTSEFEHRPNRQYFEILQSSNRGDDENAILSQLAKQTGVDFDFVWGGLDRYCKNVAGNIIISVEINNAEKVKAYLNERQITWRQA